MTSFVALEDTPNSLANMSGKLLAVNQAGDGIILTDGITKAMLLAVVGTFTEQEKTAFANSLGLMRI